jgi:hypothetical protein
MARIAWQEKESKRELDDNKRAALCDNKAALTQALTDNGFDGQTSTQIQRFAQVLLRLIVGTALPQLTSLLK